MSKVKSYYHIVFCTKERRMTLPPEYIEDLDRFIWKIITDLNCKLIRIGGIENHLHLLIELHQEVALSKLVQAVKSRSSGWMHTDRRFNLFTEWAKEYFASTVSPEYADNVREYIKNQVEHHSVKSFAHELEEIYRIAGLKLTEYDMR